MTKQHIIERALEECLSYGFLGQEDLATQHTNNSHQVGMLDGYWVVELAEPLPSLTVYLSEEGELFFISQPDTPTFEQAA